MPSYGGISFFEGNFLYRITLLLQCISMSNQTTPKTHPMMSEPPTHPPVALGLLDDDGDSIRKLGDQIAALSRSDAATLHWYLTNIGAIA